MATFDLVVIGAGLFGLSAARTFLEIHPEAKVLILEAGQSIGGVWSKDRVYDAFWTQTPLDMVGFSDDPITEAPERDQYFQLFAARHVASYHEDYTRRKLYSGVALYDRVKFGAKVQRLTKDGDTWIIETAAGTFKASRIADASGLTSEPQLPSFKGLNTFPNKLHHKDFAQSDVLTNEKLHNIVVIGGAKSAADMAYACAKAGKNVTWVIRRSGSGPAAFFGIQSSSPNYRNSNEGFYNRFMGYLVASDYARYPFWVSWLYRTSFGTRLLRKFWDFVTYATFAATDYDRADGKENGFFNLKPDTPLFWQNDSSCVNNRVDLLDTFAKRVKIYREDVESVGTSLRLVDGTEIPADALLFGTGFRNTYSYLSRDHAASLGLPVSGTSIASTTSEHWTELETQAAAIIKKTYPILDNPPQHPRPSVIPYRLYNTMAPLSDGSILFLGHCMTGNQFRMAEVQALWMTAFWDGMVGIDGTPIPPPLSNPHKRKTISLQEARRAVARKVAWGRARYLSKGYSGNWLYYEVLGLSDALLDDVGVTSHRRGLLRPVFSRDLADVLDEYRVLVGRAPSKPTTGAPLQPRGGLSEVWEGVVGMYRWVRQLLPLDSRT